MNTCKIRLYKGWGLSMTKFKHEFKDFYGSQSVFSCIKYSNLNKRAKMVFFLRWFGLEFKMIYIVLNHVSICLCKDKMVNVLVTFHFELLKEIKIYSDNAWLQKLSYFMGIMGSFVPMMIPKSTFRWTWPRVVLSFNASMLCPYGL